MATRRRKIKVPKGAVEMICQSQGCGKTTVYAALNYTSFSEEAKHIRKIAVDTYGGIEVPDVKF